VLLGGMYPSGIAQYRLPMLFIEVLATKIKNTAGF
jgi:hypothetical protein